VDAKTIDRQKHIALVAHDNRKEALVGWAQRNRDILAQHSLCGTGTTAALIAKHTGLAVKAYRSGPLGGDQQIGAGIVDGEVDMLVFFWDPLDSMPHDPDVKALLRIAVVYDVPVAMSESTADFIMTSRLMNEKYVRHVLGFGHTKQ
jgi:methylglyoxal synthase